VKLRAPFSTVEWRSPDAALPSQVVQLADDVVGTVERAVHSPVTIEGERGEVTPEAVVLPAFDAVQEYVRAAIQDGLGATPVRNYLDRMGFDGGAYEPLTQAVDCGAELTPQAARRIRLEQADRLEKDVRRAGSLVAD
jgi:hypothetical protein